MVLLTSSRLLQFVAVRHWFHNQHDVCLSVCPTAMSSYLYIVKSEFPLVIQAFLKVDNPAG